MCSLLVYFLPDRFKTLKMCKRGVKQDPWCLKYVPDHLRTQEMCEIAVEKNH